MKRHFGFLLSISLFWFSQYVFVPYFTPHLAAIGVIPSMIGVIAGAYGFSQMLLRVPLGIVADRLRNHRLIMLLGFACLIAAGALLRVAGHPAAFLAARFLAGVSSATWVSFTVFYTGRQPASEMGRAVGALLVANNLGTMASYLFGILFYETLGMSGVFMCSIAAAALGGLALLLAAKDGRGAGQESGAISAGELKMAARDRGLLLYSALAALMQLIAFATFMSFTANYAKEIGAGGRELAFLSVVAGAAGVLGSYWMRTARSGKIGARSQMAAAFLMIAAYCAVVPNSRSMAWIFAAQAVAGLGHAVAMALTMARALRGVPQAARSTAMGIYQSVYGLGMTLGPVLMGAILELAGGMAGGSAPAFYSMAAISAAGALWSAAALKESRGADGAGRQGAAK
ncbi:MAG: MFS transporter [Clostridiales bacterium]|nr:MFS transporter [Clostridiales bacterium]